MSEVLAADGQLDARRRSIATTMAAIDERTRAVTDNTAEVEEAAYKRVDELMAELKRLSTAKVAALLAEELELRRQLQQIEWMEAFATSLQVLP